MTARSNSTRYGLAVRLRRPRPAAVALARPRHVQRALGAAQPDVEQAALLVERLGVALRVRDRDEAALEAGDEDRVPLEALGPVEREQLDRVVGDPAVVLAAQRGAQELEELGDGARARWRPRGTRGRARRSPRGARARPRTPRSASTTRSVRCSAKSRPGRRAAFLRSSSSALRTSGRSRNARSPRTRNGIPARRSASSNGADCALTRYSTARSDQRRPSWASRQPRRRRPRPRRRRRRTW